MHNDNNNTEQHSMTMNNYNTDSEKWSQCNTELQYMMQNYIVIHF